MTDYDRRTEMFRAVVEAHEVFEAKRREMRAEMVGVWRSLPWWKRVYLRLRKRCEYHWIVLGRAAGA